MKTRHKHPKREMGIKMLDSTERGLHKTFIVFKGTSYPVTAKTPWRESMAWQEHRSAIEARVKRKRDASHARAVERAKSRQKDESVAEKTLPVDN